MPLPALAATMLASGDGDSPAGDALQYALVGGISLAIIGGGIWATHKVISDSKQRSHENKALNGGNAEYYARLLGKQLYTKEWWERAIMGGIDEEAVYNTLASIPKGMMNEVVKSFSAQFKITLADELKEKLWINEYQKALSIINNRY